MSDVDAADLDAELLALADGDSSDEEFAPQQPSGKSPSPLSPTRDAESPPPPSPAKPVAKKASKPKKPKKVRRGSSEEEGEASDDDEGLDSAPMSESDADAGSPDSVSSGPLFPIENKYYSEKDKAEVLAKPEVEREALLAERATLLERKQQNTILSRLAESKAPRSRTLKKRKASTELEDGERKSSRQRTLVGGRKVGETNSAMEAYKAQREQKGMLAEQRKAEAAERRAGKGRRNSFGDSEADAEGESEVEWDDTKAKQPVKPTYDEPAELMDFNRVMVGRSNFALVCFYPGFEATVRDCYIRVNMGGNPATGESNYRMAKIVSIVEGRPYAVEGKNEKKFVTTQHVRCTVGKSEHTFPFIFCSMTRPNEREFAQYKSQVTNDGQLLPKKNFLISKIDQINALVNRRFTEDELQDKLKRAGILKQKDNAIERKSLIAKRKVAESTGDQEAIDHIDQRLEELRPPKLAYGTSLFSAVDNSPRQKTQQERLAELNRANRRADTRDIRRAQLAEQRAKAELRRAVERGEANPDPLARINVQPRIHHDTSSSSAAKRNTLAPDSQGNSRAVTPASRGSTPKPGEASTTRKTPVKAGGVDWAKFDAFAAMNKSANGAGKDANGEKKSVFKRKMCDDEILANMDFGLDEDLLVS